MYRKVIIARIGEIALKGLNRSKFEQRLARNMRQATSDCGPANIRWSQSRFYVEPENDSYNIELAMKRLTKVFGIVSISLAYEIESEFDKIKELSYFVMNNKLEAMGNPKNVRFKVETKRGLKSFPMQSLQVSSEIGGSLDDDYECLIVDVHNPDITLFIELRENTYVYTDIVKACGGMPVGSNGKACLLLSGGIDSPVAGYMIGKRGVNLCAVHFYSYHYTSERAKEKVIELAKLVAKYTGTIKLAVVPFTDIQLAIDENCRSELSTVIMRRSMMRIACRVARINGCSAIITGEAVGQVASQTMQAIYCTNEACDMPVYRPLIGMDKMEVVAIAQDIGTFETSILPYEDCCTVFTPKHPKTKPSLKEVVEEEEKYNYKELENIAVENIEVISCS